MLTQYINLQSDFSGEWSIERPEFSWREGEGGWPVYARALVCPHCLTVWARLTIIGQFRYCVEGTTCLKCMDFTSEPTEFPGSILDNYTCNGTDWGLIDALPEPLLRREFELHLRSFP